MKELPKKPGDLLPQLQLQDAAVAPTVDRRGNPAGTTSDVQSAATAPTTVLGHPHLLHPVNAGPLADLLGQLQHSHGNSYVQRLVAEVSAVPGGVTAAEAPPQRLDTATQAAMEAAFGEDLSDVRLHTANPAQDAAAARGARAFTHGRDVYFGAGEYDPISRAGREVLAHELAHVVQQRQGERGQASPANAMHEHEAHAAARLAAAGHPAPVTHAADTSAVQMLERSETPAAHQPQPPTPAPKPPVPAQALTLTIALTPTIVAAATRLLNDAAFENHQIEPYVAPDHDRPRVLMNALALFPAAWQEIITQKPMAMELTDFLIEFGRVLWAHIREPFLRTMDQRYQSDRAFRHKVDRARHKKEAPDVSVSPGSAVA